MKALREKLEEVEETLPSDRGDCARLVVERLRGVVCFEAPRVVSKPDAVLSVALGLRARFLR